MPARGILNNEVDSWEDNAQARRVVGVDENGNPYNDSNRLPVDAQLEVGDIQIGAVEIKNRDTDDRQIVNPAGQASVMDYSNLVPTQHDQISMTYVTSGNGLGEIETVTYKLSTATVATLTLSYDSNNNLIDVVKS